MKNFILLTVCCIFAISIYKGDKVEQIVEVKNEPRIIKKYLNRKLYDTKEGKYVNLEDINNLILGNVDFVVIENKSKEDITKIIVTDVLAKKLKSNTIVNTNQVIDLVFKFN